MARIDENSNHNSKILLSRNTPVALIVGAATFLGSHLTDKLLLKDIQVIGVDNLEDGSPRGEAGQKENLSKASEDKNFHLIIESAENLDLDLERLDYIFVIPQENSNLKKILDLFKKFKSRLLFFSSIKLYDKTSENLRWLEEIEIDFAKVAGEHKLNARILRLGPIFGPRMSFDPTQNGIGLDPLIRLIQQSLTEDLQKDTALEFSSRALYIDDAINLAIKCILSGATAQKIFDGVALSPVKISEIKQVLLDPVWYENKDFSPTELPPWSTPNLEKTTNFLHWQPKTSLVSSLRETLSFFRDHEIKVPKLEAEESNGEKMEDRRWKIEKKEDIKGLKLGGEEKKIIKKGTGKKLRIPGLSIFIILALVGFALIWPILQLGWGVLTFRSQLTKAVTDLQKGDFEKSLSEVKQASRGVGEAKGILDSLEPIRSSGTFKNQFELGDNLISLATLSTDSAQNTILGIQALYQSLKSISGELNDSPESYFDLAKSYLASADEDSSKAQALINSQDFKSNLPTILKLAVNNLSERLLLYSNLIKKSRALSVLMPEIVALDGSKNYLVLLQNNMELRPTGGFIGSFAKVSFENGKLKKLEVNDTYAIDGQLKMHVEPPKEIKDDLDQKDYFLRDSNWEPDFPTAARQAEWFYTKETGERVEGVVALDISAIEDMLSVVAPLDLADYNEKIDSTNLFEKAISHAELNFFPGTQAKKSFLTALTSGLFNKLFFLPNQNWPGIVTSLGKSLERKHMSIYLDNPSLFSYLISQNWAAVLPRGNIDNSSFDFLAPVEANLGANKANYYLDRSYNLETVIGKDGEVSHRLRIAYTNRSPSNAFPAGKYKNRMRVYLPTGTKLTRALWGEKEITTDVSGFVDYGRTGYSLLLELLPKEQKTLVLDYQTPLKLEFKDGKAIYRLDVVKQAGTLKDSFTWSLTYPLNMKVVSNQSQKMGPQEINIQTDLSTDKTFQLEFSR